MNREEGADNLALADALKHAFVDVSRFMHSPLVKPYSVTALLQFLFNPGDIPLVGPATQKSFRVNLHSKGLQTYQ